jgi:hypothetical protein
VCRPLAPDPNTLKGIRDRCALALVVGCGLRRAEAAQLTFEHVQERHGRFCVVDIRGKRGRIRTVPVPAWVKVAIDRWSEAAQISTGRILSVNRQGEITRDSISASGILRLAARYGEQIGVKLKAHDLRHLRETLPHPRRRTRTDPAPARPPVDSDHGALPGHGAESHQRPQRPAGAEMEGRMIAAMWLIVALLTVIAGSLTSHLADIRKYIFDIWKLTYRVNEFYTLLRDCEAHLRSLQYECQRRSNEEMQKQWEQAIQEIPECGPIWKKGE